MYKIMGEYRGEQEELDSSNSFIEAEYMLAEYQMAFGQEWAIWIV